MQVGAHRSNRGIKYHVVYFLIPIFKPCTLPKHAKGRVDGVVPERTVTLTYVYPRQGIVKHHTVYKFFIDLYI